MTIKQELVHKVKNYFGLNIYETKVWLALLIKGVASAGEIAEISGVPRSRTYDVLENLEKRGFAMQKIGKPVKYLAVKPVQIIDKLKKNVSDEMEERIKALVNIRDTKEYQELELLHNSNMDFIKKQDISSTIKGRLNINSQITDTLNSAKKEIMICSSVEEFRKRQKLLEPVLKQVKKSGVKLFIALNGSDADISALSQKFDLKINKIDVDASFYIGDRSEILFMLNKLEESQEQIAVWFASPFFVQSFTGLVDMALKRANGK